MRELLVTAVARLTDAGVPSPLNDAELLLASAMGVTRSDIVRRRLLGGEVDVASAKRFWAMIDRRAAREPLQHITGKAPFRGIELEVGPGVFVPRPETESVAQIAIDEAAQVALERGRVLVADLCTGSGAIALAVACEVPATVFAVELDADAYEWAARNIARIAPHVDLIRGDARTALTELDGLVDVVVTNPPYVPPGAVPRDPEVADHDPAVALYGLGQDGLEVARGIVKAAARLLRPGGLLVMEHSEAQAEAARRLVVDENAFEDPRTASDLTGRPRMVVARRGAVRNTVASVSPGCGPAMAG
jgi:release factor glutamine methyltransferase